jgi:hypothetical protein
MLIVAAAIGLSSMPVAADTDGAAHCYLAMGDADRDCGGSMMGSECSMNAAGCTPPAITATPAFLPVTTTRADLTDRDATPFSSLALAPDNAPPKHIVV